MLVFNRVPVVQCVPWCPQTIWRCKQHRPQKPKDGFSPRWGSKVYRWCEQQWICGKSRSCWMGVWLSGWSSPRSGRLGCFPGRSGGLCRESMDQLTSRNTSTTPFAWRYRDYSLHCTQTKVQTTPAMKTKGRAFTRSFWWALQRKHGSTSGSLHSPRPSKGEERDPLPSPPSLSPPLEGRAMQANLWGHIHYPFLGDILLLCCHRLYIVCTAPKKWTQRRVQTWPACSGKIGCACSWSVDPGNFQVWQPIRSVLFLAEKK